MVSAPASDKLSAMLADMDAALVDEITQVKRYDGAGRSATNGQLVSELGGHYVYGFSLNEPWEPADDTPLVLKVRGSQPVRGSVVTASGTSLTIAVDEQLAPDALARVELVDDPVQLLERLREALKSNTEGTAQLGSKSFGLVPFQTGSRLPQEPFSDFTPRQSQLAAIQLALGSEVAYIIGPPGTGKTRTLAATAYALVREGRTVLIAAHTNIAVDNAISRLGDMCQYGNVPALEAGRIIRYGTPQLASVSQRNDVYPPNIMRRLGQGLERRRTELRTHQSRTLDQLKSLSQDGTTAQWQAKRQSLLDQRQACAARLTPLQAAERQRIAQLDAELQGMERSVTRAEQELVSARTALTQLTAQQAQHEAARTTALTQVSELTARLVAAQQMKPVTRFFKGLNVGRLAQQTADAKHNVWSAEHALRELESKLEGAHSRFSTSSQELQQLAVRRQELAQERRTPSDAAQQVTHLQAEVDDCERQIAEGDRQLADYMAQMNAQEDQLKKTVEQLTHEIATVDEQLRDLEKRLLDEAQVVATTLSKTYMDSRLREKRFDVVILDEVSMAPLPAVYVATSRAEHAVIAIGDPLQLPPIVRAKSDVARKWLGHDLFAQAGVSLRSTAEGESRSALLSEQFRMDPQISVIARRHVYDGLLEDAERPETSLDYRVVQPLPGKALVLCDTSDASPTASRPPEGSRVNFYHAFCAVALAREALQTLPAHEVDSSNPHRVGIVTPYRKQAELIQRLIKSEKLDQQVRVGTVHRFQGLEFEAIIFDTVESPPMRDSHRFVAGGRHSSAQRLINVAVTRAQHKLIIIANLTHIRNTFARDDTLFLAIGEAERSAVLQSAAVLPGLIARSNVARGTKPTGNVPSHLLDQLEALDETTFFDRFLDDVGKATRRIVILSPFIGAKRSSEILPYLAAKRQAGVEVVIIASQSERDHPLNERAVADLQLAGIEVRTSAGMHEKLAFIDDNVVYHGSLNPLSHVGTTEFMVRFATPEIVKYFEHFTHVTERARKVRWGDDFTLRVSELPTDTCSKCGNVLRPRMGNYGAFNGCGGYPNCKGQDISENQLAAVPALTSVPCTGCGQSNMRPRAQRRDRWLECAAAQPCDYRRKIVITE